MWRSESRFELAALALCVLCLLFILCAVCLLALISVLCAKFAAAPGFQVAGSAGAAFEGDASSDDADYKPGEESEFDSSGSEEDGEAATTDDGDEVRC